MGARLLCQAPTPRIGAGYVNFLDADDQPHIEDTYAGNYARLAQVKAKYDPGNLFHINQNIKPAG